MVKEFPKEKLLEANRIRELQKLISEDPSLILLIQDKYLDDELWEQAIRSNPKIFEYTNKPSHKIIKLALSCNGENIKFLVPKNIKITGEYINIALTNNPYAIYFLPKDMQTLKVREFACLRDPSLIKYMEVSQKFIDIVIAIDPLIVKYIPNPTDDQWIDAIKIDPWVMAHMKYFSPKVKEVVREVCPRFIPHIPQWGVEPGLNMSIDDQRGLISLDTF